MAKTQAGSWSAWATQATLKGLMLRCFSFEISLEHFRLLV